MLFYVWATGVCVFVQGHPLWLNTRTAHFTPPAAPLARLMHWPHSSNTDKERDRTTEIERVKQRGLKTEGDIPTSCSQTTSLRRFLIRLQIITLMPRNRNGCSLLTHRAATRPLHHQFNQSKTITALSTLLSAVCFVFLSFSFPCPLCFSERFAWETSCQLLCKNFFQLVPVPEVCGYVCASVRETEPLISQLSSDLSKPLKKLLGHLTQVRIWLENMEEELVRRNLYPCNSIVVISL